MPRIPFGHKPRHSIVLTSEGLWIGAPGLGAPVAHAPLAPGILGARNPGDLSSLDLHEPELLREAVQACLGQLDRPVRRAHLALDGLLLRTVTLPLPFVPPREELELAVRSEAERYRVFAGEEVACDFAMLDPTPGGLTLLLAAARRTAIGGIVEVFERLGISILTVEPAPLAVLRGLAERGDAPRSSGLIAVFPQQLHLSVWEGETLHSWRTLHASASRLRDGDEETLLETRIDLQRSLVEHPLEIAYLLDAPDPLVAALSLPGGMETQVLPSLASSGESLAMAGARLYAPERGPFVFDVRQDRLKPAKPPVSRGVGVPLAFAGVLTLGLAANLWLSERVKAHEDAAEQLQAEIEVLQARMTRPDPRRETTETLREALNRSESVATLFRRFQDATPHDVWLSKTELEAESRLVVEGYALSRTSPLALARALGESRALSEIDVPELAEATWQGEPVYRFRLEAAFRPQGAFRP